MNSRRYLAAFSVTAVLCAIPIAQAIVLGGSNLGVFGYPAHECSPPYNKPTKPYQFTDQWEVDHYNSQVRQYNDELEAYFDCINEYVDNAKNDIRRIKEAANNAIAEANAL